MAHAVLAGRAAATRERPANRAFVPQWLARSVGLAALGSLGVLEWQRLIGDLGTAHALLWVAVAVAAAAGVLLARRRTPLLVLVVLVSLAAGYALSSAPMDLLRPR